MKRNWLVLAIVLLNGLIVNSCGGDDEKPEEDIAKDRSTTISLFGGARSATVKGKMTNAQWSGVASKIEGKLNDRFDGINETLKNRYLDIFARGVTYIVEVTPSGYTNVKTIGDGKTVYIALSAVDTSYVIDGVSSIYINGSETAQIKKQNRVLFGGGMSPFEFV